MIIKSCKKISILLLSICMFLEMGVCHVRADSTENDGTYILFKVTIEEELPKGTQVSIGSNVNSWNPKDPEWIAEKVDETHYQVSVKIDESYVGTKIDYKWTLQYADDPKDSNGWDHVEKVAATKGAFGNRTYKLKKGKNMVEDSAVFNKSVNIASTVNGGELETFELQMPQFDDGRKRTIRVWLPEGYDKDKLTVKYPVLYMHDGQNLFDDATSFVGEWKVDESLSNAFKKGYEKIIVVGIDNGGAERFNELSPEWTLNPLGQKYITEPAGSKYADFIINTVKPYIDSNYNTKSDRENTGIGGSSMGGAMSFYMALKYSDRIGYGIIFSPAMHLYDDNSLEKFIKENVDKENQPILYIYAGGAQGSAEKGSAYDESLFTKYVDFLKNSLEENNYSEKNIGIMTDLSKSHTESCWAEIFPTAYKWIMDAKVSNSNNITSKLDKTQSEKTTTKYIFIIISIVVTVLIILLFIFGFRKYKKYKCFNN